MSDLVPPFPRAARGAITVAARYRPGRHGHHDGLLQHAFATAPWLGAIVVVAVVLVALAFGLLRNAGRVLDGAHWYVRAALLVTAGFGIVRLLSRDKPRRSAAC